MSKPEPPCKTGSQCTTKCMECAEPTPVAWVHLESWKTGKFWPDDCFSGLPVDEWTPLYTSPPKREWQGLTDEQVEKLVDDEDWYNDPNGFVRAIEAKLKEKNSG